MSINVSILSFNAGELTPKIDIRSDTEKYQFGCRRFENFMPTKYGGAEKRPGLKFISDATEAPS